MDKEYLYIDNEDGEEIKLLIERSFFYNAEEYAVLLDESDETRYVMQVKKNGEDMEDFIPIEEELQEAILTALELKK